MKYFDELKKTMEWLGSKENTIFIGQAVEVPGTAMFNTLKDIEKTKRVELPVFEDTQMGMSIGMSLAGKKVISIFPRWNFLLCATNQLVSHLDKLPIISEGKVTPNILIRTAVGSQRPLFPGYQHIGNMSSAFREMLSNVEIIELFEPEDISPAYKKAFERDDGKSTILVEFQDFYNEK
jgi:pyruvate/2-oxoglutarate/acetoin dehydrogenase E1 component